VITQKQLTREEVLSKMDTFTNTLEDKIGFGHHVQVSEYKDQQSKYAFQVLIINNGGIPLDKFLVKVNHSNEFWWS
jgi:hypothetical protein